MGLDRGVQVARLSLFLSEPHAISDNDWAIVTGQQEAETRQAVLGGKRLSGSVPSGVMHMSTMASRFDVILTATDLGEAEEVQLPSAGPYDETFASFFESTRKWIMEAIPPVTRIAFGAVLYMQSRKSRRGVRSPPRPCAKSLSSTKKYARPSISGELARQEQGPTEFVVNRLTTWSAIRIARQLVQISQTAVEGSDTGHVDAVHLEMDDNTDEANKAPFDPGMLIPIYSELVELARQNAAEGEVACS